MNVSTFVGRINAHLLLLFLTESFHEQVMRDEITAEKVTREVRAVFVNGCHCYSSTEQALCFIIIVLFCTLNNCWQLQAEQQAMFTTTKSLLTFKLIHIPILKPMKIKPLSTGALKSMTFLFTSTLGKDYKCLKESWGTRLHILYSSYQTQLDAWISKSDSPNVPAISQ